MMKTFHTFAYKALFVFVLTFSFSQLSYSQTGTHLHFDGVDDYISSAQQTTVSNNFTIEFWVNPTATTSLPAQSTSGIAGTASPERYVLFPAFQGGTSTTTASGAGITVGTNGICVFEHSGGYLPSLLTYSTTINTWTHVAVVYTNKQPILYVNGVLVATGLTSPETAVYVSNSGIGGGAYGYFNGSIDEVRIWNYSATAADILRRKNCELQGNETGLYAYYKFNQGTASGSNTTVTTLTDAAPVPHNATLNSFALTGTSSNWLSGSPVTTGIAVPSAPTASAQSFCGSATVANLVATGTNIKWYAAATGGTALVSTTALVSGTTYYASQSNANGCESTRTGVAVTINAIPSAPTASAQAFCGSATVANLVATGTAIQWYAAASGGTALVSTTALVNGTTYYASQTVSTCESTTRTGVAVTINAIPSAPTASAQAFCGSATVANLVATGTAIKWYAAASGGSALVSTTALVTGTTYYASQTVSTCESTTRTGVAVTINAIPAAPTASAQAFCGSATVANLVATGTAIQWYATSTGGTALASTTALVDGTTYYASQTVSTCESATRTGAAITIYAIPSTPSVSTPINYLKDATASTLTATGNNLLWYTTATGGTGSSNAPTPITTTVGTISYWVTQTVSTCESARAQIDVTVTLPATHLNFDGVNDAISATNSNFPLGNTARTIEAWIKTTQNNGGGAILTYGNLSANNRFALYQSGGILYFVAEGNDYNTNVAINDGIWHHVAATFDGTNLKIYKDGVQVGTNQAKTFNTTGTQLSIGYRGIASEFFNGNIDEVRIWNVAVSADDILSRKNCELQGTESGLVAYYKFNQGIDALTNTGITTLNNSTATTGLNGTLTGFALTGATSNWLAGSPVTTGSIIPTAPSVSTSVSYCRNAPATPLTATGTNLKWYTTATSGTGSTTAPTPSTTTSDTTSYWVTSSNANGCESERAKIDVILNPSTPSVSTPIYYAKDATAIALTATGANLLWYTAASGGTGSSIAPTPNTSTLGTSSYWVTQTNANGCESARALINIGIIRGHIYVKKSATGTNDGNSWANAYTDLQNAINNGSEGDTIWVAADTYYPTRSALNTTSLCTNCRDNAFVLKSGVSILGGFSGNETLSSERNIKTNITILSGDLGTLNNNNDNAYHVVIAAFADTTAKTILDGFNITNGNANGSNYITVNGQLINQSYGGGIYSVSGKNQISNTQIVSNNAKGTNGTNGSNGSVTPYRCGWSTCYTVVNATSGGAGNDGYGAGIYIKNGLPNIYNCIISQNNVSGGNGGNGGNGTDYNGYYAYPANGGNGGNGRGAGVFIDNATATITNSTVVNNQASGSSSGAGGFAWFSGYASNGSVGSSQGAGIYTNNATLNIHNSIIWNNNSGYASQGGALNFANSDVQSGAIGTGNINTNPLFLSGTYVLSCNSPCVNTGNNTYVSTEITKDIANNNRILNTTVDMGAYEADTQVASPTVTTPIKYCQNATANQLSATGNNLKWYTAATGGTGSSTAPTPNTNIVDTTSYWVVSTNENLCESPRTKIDVIKKAPSANPTVVTPVSYCQNTTAIPLTATGDNLKWYTTATSGTSSTTAPTPSTTAIGTISYWVTQTDTSTCESARVKMDVTINALPTVSITGANAICVGATTTLSPTTGGTWASSNIGFATVTNAGVVSGVASGAPTFTFTQTSTGCVSLATSAITVNAIPSAPSVSTPVYYAQNATASALTATGTSLLWYTASTGGTGSATAPTPITTTVGTTSYWVSQTVSTCESARAKIDVTVALPATHLNFDGVNDAVSATNSNFPLGNTARTIEAWIKTTQNNGGGAILTYGDLSANNRFALYQSGGVLNFVAEGNDYNTGVAINDGVWHHVAATFDGTSLKIYKDGVQVGTTQIKTFNTTGTQLSIGYRGIAAEYFNGNIDEVRIWNIALSADDILSRKNCELQGNEAGLVAYYKFNQGIDAATNTAVTTLTDATANANNGTLNGFDLTGSTSNWLAGSPVTTGIVVPTATITGAVSACTSVSLTASGGATYAWSGGATPSVSANNFTTSGAYTVTVTNANGCSASTTATATVVDCNDIYTGTTSCYTVTLNNVQGNTWFDFIAPSGIIASINPNGTDMGTVTLEVSDAGDVINYNGVMFLGRSTEFTSSNYPNSAVMPNNYSLRIYYKDSELTEYNTAMGGSFGLSDFNMTWQEGGSGCNLATYNGGVTGVVSKTQIVNSEYGTGNNGFYFDLPLNHFTIFAATTSNAIILPIELISFSGNTKSNDNILEWQTATEENSSHFELQHSLNGIDFEMLGKITAEGKSAAPKSYSYLHQNPKATTHYYRLKMVDKDGSFKYSLIVSLTNSYIKKAVEAIKIYPNPTKSSVNIVTTDYTQPMRLYNANGALMMSTKATTEQLDMSQLPAGMYFLHVGKDVIKVVKD